MKNDKKQLAGMLAVMMGSVGAVAQAALPDGAILEFNPGVPVYDSYGYIINISSGSYFAMDFNNNRKFTGNEKTPISMFNGIIIGTSQPASGSHAGTINGTESPDIDAPWEFFGNTGMFQTLSPVIDNGDGTLDFSGLGVTWNGIPNIPLGDAVNVYPYLPPDTLRANITCSSNPCQVGDTYVLDYRGHVPLGDVSGFGGVWVALHLEGTITSGPALPRVSISVEGGAQQECLEHGGTPMTVNADVMVPEGDALAAINWTLDGESVGSGSQIVTKVPLGTHSLEAELSTQAGLTVTSSMNLIVRDTQGPAVDAAFISRQTGLPVASINKTGQYNIRATASDVCDPNPAVTAMVGAPVTDGGQVNVQVEQSWMRLDTTQMTLSVTARDASNNAGGGTATLTIGQ